MWAQQSTEPDKFSLAPIIDSEQYRDVGSRWGRPAKGSAVITATQANTKKFRVRTSRRLGAEWQDTGTCNGTQWITYAAGPGPGEGVGHELQVKVSWDSGSESWHSRRELFPE